MKITEIIKHIKKNIMTFFVVLAIFMVVFLFFIYKKSTQKLENKEITSIKTYKTNQELVKKEDKKPKIDIFKLKGIEKQKLIWELKGDSVILNFEKNKDKLKIFSPKIYFYDKLEKNKISSWMSAKNAIVNTKNKNMKAFGNVVISSEKENIKLFTEEVFYDKKKEIFFSDKFVSIIQGENLTEGIGFDAKSDFTEINIRKNVKIKYVTDDDKKNLDKKYHI